MDLATSDELRGKVLVTVRLDETRSVTQGDRL